MRPSASPVKEYHVFERFFVAKRKDGSFNAVSAILIHKAILANVGEVKSVKKCKNGNFLIEVWSQQQAANIMKMERIGNYEITVAVHTSLNLSRGVTSESQLQNDIESDILEDLKDQNVIAVRRITVKRDGQLLPTKNLILTFSLPTIPKSVRIAYLNCSVRPYIPKPLRCFKCQRFGHTLQACRGIQSCARCSLPGHESQTCSETPCCINCKSDHPAYSKTCPRWKIEKEIQTVKIKQNLSFKEARKIVMDRTPRAGVSYYAVAKGLMVSSSTQTSSEAQSHEKIKIPTSSPTKPSNLPYFGFSSPSLAIKWDFSVADDLHNSDNFPIILSYSNDDVTYPQRPKRYIFNKADWTLFSQTALISKQLVEKESIDDVVYELTDILMTAADAAIPKTSGKIPKNWKPWWNEECGIAEKNQAKAWNRFRRYPTTDNFIAFKQAKANARRRSQRNSWMSFVNSINSRISLKLLWDKIRKISGYSKNSLYLSVLNSNGQVITDIKKIANALGSTFATVSSETSYLPNL
ncbi:hypothetical protein AVEN_274948-1 [Araneus ventricosus]|uniref:CCHC-type domain-containing protein n=1 Tax=Araneus ventricosus TaxID=182803 RepID=A0A4Y2QIQ3_ARAVE|nr:hypothetical protein AVEN_274948-1 [Araneus ventricosus]